MATPTPRAIVSSVRTFVRRHDILRPGPLVLAVSGGTDSTALTLIMAELAEEFGLVLHVAHFDHRARPRDAAADADFVAKLADRIGAPIRAGRAERAPKSEDDARRERYAFLRRAAEQIGATAIATGHTRDDQAETVLLRLARGTGIAGAAAMRPLREGIARPLLDIGRAETAAICAAARVTPRDDPTNTDLRFARNRVRLRVLPELEQLNPQVRVALARFAEAAADADAIVAAASAGAPAGTGRGAAEDVQPRGNGLERAIDVRALPADAALREHTLATAWRAAAGSTLSARHRAALADLAATTHGSKRLDLPGGLALREYTRLTFAPHAGVASRADETPRAHRAATARTRTGVAASVPLTRGTSVEWHGWRIAVGMTGDGLRYSAGVDAVAADRLVVRARRPGDRIGRGKLQDVFVDRKVPARLRDTWPVIALNGQALWVPGLTAAPRTGRTRIAAGPVGDGPTAGEDVLGSFTRKRQVASKAEARPKGEKRGSP